MLREVKATFQAHRGKPDCSSPSAAVFCCDARIVTRGRGRMENRLNGGGEPRFEAIFKAEPECVKVLDGAGRILQMNPAGLGILEAKSSEEVIGRPMFDFVVPAQHEQVRQ